MIEHSAHPTKILAGFWRNRELILASTKREVLGRYKGSALGLLWSFVTPLFMLTVYTFVFSEIFKAKWNTNSNSKVEFALVLFAGLIIFNLFAECVSRAATLILANPNYVKKVIFPLEILPFVVLLSALYHAFVSLTIWLAAYWLLIGPPQLTILYIPLIILPYSLFILGLSWTLAFIGVFIRDVSQFIGLAITVLMFLSPIFFPASALPEKYQLFIYLNPLTPVIEMTRDVLYWGKPPLPIPLIATWIFSIACSWVGFAGFQKTRKGFADVL